MKLQDALLAGSDHGSDRMSVEADRRLRRRLGLESAPATVSTRPVWFRPAIAAFAVAAVVVAVIYFRPRQQSQPTPSVVAAFVDVSKAPWSGTVTGNEIEVLADSPASATVTWVNASIVAAPGTRMAASSAGSLVLTHGAVQIQRTESKPMFVDVPMGRVVISAYRSSVTVDPESVTILINDGTGHYVDADGQAHALSPDAPLVWPPEDGPRQGKGSSPDETIPAEPPPSRRVDHRRSVVPGPGPSEQSTEHSGPPGMTPPSVPRRPDVPCTFKSDCEPGATCRKNEDGNSVCMGNGGEGAACWFDNDCLSRRCVQRRCASPPSTP
jgi:hypothetical protein